MSGQPWLTTGANANPSAYNFSALAPMSIGGEQSLA
jgi:hypothetical protein